MKRRDFNLLGASSAAALAAGIGLPGKARAAVTADQAALLKTTLTPYGAERAGNADGSIPAWTGGLTEVPAGRDPNTLMPDFFASDAKIISIDASNMEQYADRLTDGVMAMMTKYPDFRIDVYPTHRTAAAPQWVYDNIYQNALNAQPDPAGARLGFTGAYGGIPFPIPSADPYEAGSELIWNHLCDWRGPYIRSVNAAYYVSGGQMTQVNGYNLLAAYPFYKPDGNLASFDGWDWLYRVNLVTPASVQGQQYVEYQSTNPLVQVNEAWIYLTGQGRVRKAPELSYDTPAGTSANIANQDEFFGFRGAQDRYDWKYLGKKEMYIPYNNNKLFLTTAEDAHHPHTLNPDVVRWELHRVHVVDATLHPGERNVIAHRRFYLVEDTSSASIIDGWDAQGNIWRVGMVFYNNRPDLPGTVYGNNVVYNLQTDQYVTQNGQWGNAPYNGERSFAPIDPDTFNPQSMAAQSQF